MPQLSADDCTRAVEAAERAFPTWAKLTAKQRSDVLRKWYELIVANREDLALILTSEQGKPLSEALGEVDIGGAYVEFFAEEARRIYGETIPSLRPDARLLAIKQIGVCGAITPWNFPNSMITRKVSPALAAGCTVVLKPASETPLSALGLVALGEKAGVPKGVFNVITGDSQPIGKVLCEHPAVRFVGFTGSTEVGKILYRQASVGVKKLGLELGGDAPFVVFDDADIDAAVQGAMVSKYRNMGQTCVCANRIYAQAGIYDEFMQRLSKKVAAMKIGDGTEQGVVQGPLINMEAVDKIERHIADAVKRGAKVATGGKRHARGRSLFEPTVLADVTSDPLVSQEETFGPLAPVIRFKDEADVIAMCNASPFGLASYFYSRDLGRVWRVAEALLSGMVGINTGLITTEVAPFGGVKESGLGRGLPPRHGRICRDQIRDDGGALTPCLSVGSPSFAMIMVGLHPTYQCSCRLPIDPIIPKAFTNMLTTLTSHCALLAWIRDPVSLVQIAHCGNEADPLVGLTNLKKCLPKLRDRPDGLHLKLLRPIGGRPLCECLPEALSEPIGFVWAQE
ncbi:succinate-semialdehyde dehydrogenase/glutarate-semialdehyde dehydrogenase [Bradyrhizobium sp. RT5a]